MFADYGIFYNINNNNHRESPHRGGQKTAMPLVRQMFDSSQPMLGSHLKPNFSDVVTLWLSQET